MDHALWGKESESSIAFLEARPNAGSVAVSVSPLENPDTEFEGLEEDGRLPSGEVLEDVGTQLEIEEEPDHLRKLVDPKLPTQDKVDEHYLRGHVPYRNWCPVCIQARGKDMDHQKDSGKERKLPECAWDYCFPGDELGFKWTVLVGRERSCKSWMATAIPNKGSTGKFGVDKCLEFFEENGGAQGTIIIKSDQ